MAQATVSEKTVYVPTTSNVVNLELTMEEAAALRALVGSISGSPQDSIRKYTEALYDALVAAGVPQVKCVDSYPGFHFNATSWEKNPFKDVK